MVLASKNQRCSCWRDRIPSRQRLRRDLRRLRRDRCDQYREDIRHMGRRVQLDRPRWHLVQPSAIDERPASAGLFYLSSVEAYRHRATAPRFRKPSGQEPRSGVGRGWREGGGLGMPLAERLAHVTPERRWCGRRAPRRTGDIVPKVEAGKVLAPAPSRAWAVAEDVSRTPQLVLRAPKALTSPELADIELLRGY